jgi:hypothetical protein
MSAYYDVNWVAVIVAALLNIAMGALWYSPKALGTIWARSHDISTGSLQPSVWQYIAAVVVALITAWVLAVFINFLSPSSFSEAAGLAFLIWFGFVAATSFSGVIWAKKPILAYAIDATFELVALVVMTSLLAFWR